LTGKTEHSFSFLNLAAYSFEKEMNFLKKHHLIFALSLIAAVTVSRFIPHPPNFTPVIAMALFSGAVISKRFVAFGFPLLAMCISDMLLNRAYYPDHMGLGYFIEIPTFGVYGGILLSSIMGSLIGQNLKWKRIIGFSIGSSLLFWIVSNFFCWPGNPLYTQNIQGLLSCYIAALPFLAQTLGDLFFGLLLFGTWKITFKQTAIARS
jgi:hypothetical protein